MVLEILILKNWVLKTPNDLMKGNNYYLLPDPRCPGDIFAGLTGESQEKDPKAKSDDDDQVKPEAGFSCRRSPSPSLSLYIISLPMTDHNSPEISSLTVTEKNKYNQKALAASQSLS